MKKLTLILLVLLSVLYAKVNETRFVNTIVKFQITKPETWFFHSSQPCIGDPTIIKGHVSKYQKYLESFDDSALVQLTMYKEPYSDLNTSIEVFVNPIASELKGYKHVEILKALMPYIEEQLPKSSIVTEPHNVMIKSKKAAHTKLYYESTSEEFDKVVPARADVWLITSGDLYFIILAEMKRDASNETKQLVGQTLNSISFDIW